MKKGKAMAAAERIAAVDLGSNSFRLLLAECDGQGWRSLLRVEERVRLADGLADGWLALSAIERGLDALRELARHLRGIPAQSIRVVATHSLRAARNADDFIGPGSRILNHKIDVIDGNEEAALAYRGAASNATGNQLVIDIGGGSTEIALGCNAQLQHGISLPLGCLTLQHHFRQGLVSRDNFAALQAEMSSCIDKHWQWPIPADAAVRGSSGVWAVLAQVLARQGISDVTPQGLSELREQLLHFDCIGAIRFEGLTEARRHLFASGLAMAIALCETLDLQRVAAVNGALLEGLLSELVDRRSMPMSSSI